MSLNTYETKLRTDLRMKMWGLQERHPLSPLGAVVQDLLI